MSLTEDTLQSLVAQLRRHDYAAALAWLNAHPELQTEAEHDDLRLLRFIAELRSPPPGPTTNSLRDPGEWTFAYPELLFSERAFLALTLGRPDRAISILDPVARARFGAVEYSRLATAQLLLGDFAGAERHYRLALDLDPDCADHHNNLGGALVRLQRLEAALACYEEALTLNPHHPQAAQSRLTVAAELGRGDAALDDLQAAFDAAPERTELRLALFHALVRLRREPEAVELIKDGLVDFKTLAPIAREALANDPERIAQLNLRLALADLFGSRQRWVKALAVLNQCLTLFTEPKPVDLILRRVAVLGELREFAHAEQALAELADREDVLPPLLTITRADLLAKRGREQAALALLESLDPTQGLARRALSLRAHLELLLGRMDACHRSLLQLAETDVMAFAQMVNTRNYTPDDAVLAKLTALADNPLTPEGARETLGFALADVCHARKDYPRAFQYLAAANRISDAKVNYDPNGFSRRMEALRKAFTPALMTRWARLPPSEPGPIFVLGMPRSGTTLTESILGSHGHVCAAGELPSLGMITRALHGQFRGVAPYPRGLAQLSRAQLMQMARAYLREIPEGCKDARHIVDKMPHNFTHVGLIHLLFPDSPIVHVMRDPRDTALSNFQQNFGAKFGGMGYAFDLDKLARQINDYHRIMQHWRDLGVPMFEFWYEDLVADQLGVSERLLAYCGLDWDAGVMEFHKLERSVRTASVAQVRKRIYDSSRQKWRHYADELAPLLAAFDDDQVRFYPGGEAGER